MPLCLILILVLYTYIVTMYERNGLSLEATDERTSELDCPIRSELGPFQAMNQLISGCSEFSSQSGLGRFSLWVRGVLSLSKFSYLPL